MITIHLLAIVKYKGDTTPAKDMHEKQFVYKQHLGGTLRKVLFLKLARIHVYFLILGRIFLSWDEGFFLQKEEGKMLGHLCQKIPEACHQGHWQEITLTPTPKLCTRLFVIPPSF